MEKYRYEEFISRMAGFLLSSMLAVVVLATTYKCNLCFLKNIQVTVILTWIFWTLSLIRVNGLKTYSPFQLLIFLIMIVFLGLYLAYWIWHSGYLTNIPLISINEQENGLQYDTLFHTSIAQGIKNYGVPSFLVNSDSFFNYHFGSHLIMAIISGFSAIPVFFVYCYIYPVIFLPLFVYLIVSVIQEFRYYKSQSGTITILDFFVVICFFIPVLLPKSICDNLGNWKTSWFISESYLIAAICTLLFFKVFFLSNRHGWLKTKREKIVFKIIIIPFFIIITSLAKISFGFFLFMGVVYYFFRHHLKEIYYWIIEIYYTACFAFVYLFPGRFHSAFISNTNFSSIDLLNHIKTYIATDLWGFHIVVYYFFSLVVLSYQFRKETNIIKIVKEKKYILEEILLAICLFGAIPGNIFVIRGGSSFYFSSVQQLVAVILLLGFDIPNKVFLKLRPRLKNLTFIWVMFILFCICWDPLKRSKTYVSAVINDCKTGAALQHEEFYKNNSYWNIICKISEYTNNKESDYYIFVDESADIWNRFERKEIAMHFYPAMTGIVSIGELYYKDGQMFYNDGTTYTSGWYKTNPNDTKLTLEKAIDKASIDEKEALIYIHDGNNMEIIMTNPQRIENAF